MLTATNEGVRVHPASPIHRGRPVMRANARLILLLSKHAIPLAQDGRLSKLGFCATVLPAICSPGVHWSSLPLQWRGGV